MASDVRIIEKNGSHQHQKVERVRVKDNAFVGRSVKINVVDDTALLNVVPFSKKAKDHPKHKRNGGKHIVVGGKQQGKGNASKVGERSQLRIMYSLSQMKSMRYANMGNQKKLWSDVYARLLPELVNEYEGLVVSLKNQKNSKSNMRESGIGTKEVIDELTLEEEEEYTEENDDYNSILKPAFAVDGEPDFESGPPEERSDCKWVVALCASVETPLDDGFSQDSLKAVSLPPLEKEDSVGEMTSSEKEVKSSPFASVLGKDEESIRSDSSEASFSKEREAMDVDCHGVVSVPEATSAFLEEDRHKMEEAVEADGSAACISEKKGQEDSDVQAEVDTLAMASDVRIIEKNGSHQHQKVERVRVKDNTFVGRSVNIDVVDDTALLNVVPFSKKAKDAPRKHKKNGGKHIVGEKGNASKDVEGNELRIMYSLSQMKSMRYANMGNQKKLWSDVYARLLPELVIEYQGLVVSLKNQKTSKSNMRESGIGPVSAVPRRNRVNIFVH
ncbi:hypothetical protein F2Q68_00028290 [Brassica cretica]|uniref:Uncharacterized protein n=1 Tax=Brassica cretica TaxID=69181 RepID=A0A8S9IFD4_BRACR|nr:hypothetical protein F2Q68_00028290 [Brassica cretica]